MAHSAQPGGGTRATMRSAHLVIDGGRQHRRARDRQTARRRDGAQLQLCIALRRPARRARRHATGPPVDRNAGLA
eukprot:2939217-Prymnesium_polylepis.1